MKSVLKKAHSILRQVKNPEYKHPSLEQLDAIRSFMLDALSGCDSSSFPRLLVRIRCAEDVHALWFLRGELMAALAVIEGEILAKKKILKITEMFHGHLPKGFYSRPSPLGS